MEGQTEENKALWADAMKQRAAEKMREMLIWNDLENALATAQSKILQLGSLANDSAGDTRQKNALKLIVSARDEARTFQDYLDLAHDMAVRELMSFKQKHTLKPMDVKWPQAQEEIIDVETVSQDEEKKRKLED